jgi:arsenate reductase (thioredoxin)
MPTKRILFLCTGNSCRSQMGEAILRALAGDGVEALSAGTAPAAAVHPRALATLAAMGIDAAGLRPKSVEEFLGQQVDLMISTCDGARDACPTFAGARRRLHWGLPDPAEATGTDQEIADAFRAVADDLRRRITSELLSEIEEA